MRLGVMTMLVVAGPALAAAPILDQIDVAGDEAPAVRLHLSAPVPATAHRLPAEGRAPARIYIDLSGAALGAALPRVIPGMAPIVRVRAAQFDATRVRVVLELERHVPFMLRQTDETITVQLQEPPPTAEAPEAPAPTPTAAAPEAPAPAPIVAVPEPPAPAPAPVAAAPEPPAPAPTAAVPDPPAPTPPVAVPEPPAPASAPIAAAPEPPAPTPPVAVPEPPAPAPAPIAAAPEPPAPAVTVAAPEAPAPAPPPIAAVPEPSAPAPNVAAPEAPAPAPPPIAAVPEPSAPAPTVAATEPSAPGPTAATVTEPPAPSPPPAPPSPPQAPTPRMKPRTAPRPLVSHPPRIVLDAGHGGRDPGAAGVGGVLEKDIVLEVTQMVAGRLAARLPVEVLLTRTDDSFVPIERRIAMPGDGATLFISLHANACSDPSAQGLEVFYGGGGVRTASTPGGSWRAALLGRCLDHALQSRVGGVRGEARPGPFGVLVRNPAPSALIEIGYLTHPGEAARARDRRYHELLADAVVDGVAAFLRASAPPL